MSPTLARDHKSKQPTSRLRIHTRGMFLRPRPILGGNVRLTTVADRACRRSLVIYEQLRHSCAINPGSSPPDVSFRITLIRVLHRGHGGIS
jgi:hypothetical protein